MRKIGLFEVKAKLSEICTRVEETGTSYVITRRGKPIAKLIRYEEGSTTALGILDRMKETEAKLGPISTREPDFPNPLETRKSKSVSPLEDSP